VAATFHIQRSYIQLHATQRGGNTVSNFNLIEDMKMPKVNLTQKFIDNNLICPERQRKIEFCDTLVPGLRVDVTETSPGKGTFFYSRKIDGKRSHMKISSTLDISLKDAREYAKNLRAEYQLGGDPYAAAKAKKKVITWSNFFEQWYIPHAKQHKRSWANDQDMHRLRIKERFGNIQLNKITRHAVQQFHNELRETGFAPATCDHHLKLIRQALNLAVEWELLETNPVAKVKLFNISNAEERLMSDLELSRLMEVLDNDPNRMVCLLIKWLLYTGSRVNSEALQARWADIDRKQRTWTTQATNSKSKQRYSHPLSDAAMAILDELGTEGKSEWLFTSSRGGGRRLSTASHPWRRIRALAGLTHLRLHDLRHMHASMLVNSGHSLYVVQRVLSHSDPSVTARYSHLSAESLLTAVNSVGQYVANALEKTGK
jgi:integrase